MRVRTMDVVVVAALLAVVAFGWWWSRRPDPEPADTDPALQAVASRVDVARAQALGLSPDDLRVRDNPIGGGRVVHLARQTGGELPKKPVWIVWHGSVHAVNGSAKSFTPDMPWAWPRPEAGEESHWRGSGLVRHSAREMVRHLYAP